MCSARLNFHPPAAAQSPFATPSPCHPSPQRCHPERSEGSRGPTLQPCYPLPSTDPVILSEAKDLAAPRPSPVRSLHLTPHSDRTSPLLKLDGLCLIRYNRLMFY